RYAGLVRPESLRHRGAGPRRPGRLDRADAHVRPRDRRRVAADHRGLPRPRLPLRHDRPAARPRRAGAVPLGAGARASALLTEVWWRWGRVELPVQNPSPVTSYERVRSFSSTTGARIGTLTRGPVTCP